MNPLVTKKQEEQDLQKIRDLLRLPDNKTCFDCCAKSPFFVDMTTQTFVCARCSGLVREVGHRVKSISTSKFSGPETTCLELGGNAIARRVWLHGYTSALDEWIESDYDVRLFMRQKYYELRWFDRTLWNEHGEKVKKVIMELFTEDGVRRSPHRLTVKTASSPTSPTFILPPPPSSPHTIQRPSSLSNEDDDCPLGLTAAANQWAVPPRQQPSLIDDDTQWMTTPTSSINDAFDIWGDNSQEVTSASKPLAHTPIMSLSSPRQIPYSAPHYPPLSSPRSPASPIRPLAPPPMQLSSPTQTTSPTRHYPLLSSPKSPASPIRPLAPPMQPSSPSQIPSPTQHQPKNPAPPADPFAALRGLSF